ncbi:MAG TPA: hypothetical protein VJQ54_10330 [Candidatus Sulfotelmatobacter sp.]|nr:hypothetical protein [Candidatus Sulfotelmatobacter sp.]
MLERLSQKLIGNRRRTAIENALALQRRGEARQDGLTPVKVSQALEIVWRARAIHPWDRHRTASRVEHLFREQCYADTDAALIRLFQSLPDVDVICFRVLGQDSDDEIVAGLVTRVAMAQADSSASARTRLWQMGIRL